MRSSFKARSRKNAVIFIFWLMGIVMGKPEPGSWNGWILDAQAQTNPSVSASIDESPRQPE